ncbi:MAG TPA: hypothetical protein VNN77_08310 [candidate division Zixibacteria bacterium]|nr:hypothetical protein [candidate division Zixibacteria bacterium]
MDIGKCVVKARPGVLGGVAEEKRPLRERVALPVKRRIFINRDSHPEADVYVAIHEAENLPAEVPDYQVPHCHNTDEFYFFVGNGPGLTGLAGQIKFEGRAHRISSPATVYIPAGTVHEYKVVEGAGYVVVLFRSRGYTHIDREPDLDAGAREAERFARYVFPPEIRATSEIRAHRDSAPGTRYVFVDEEIRPEAAFYTAVRDVSDLEATQTGYVDRHTHNCDTYHITVGAGENLTGLRTEFVIGDQKTVVDSPVAVHVPAGVPHSQRLIGGSGQFFNFVPRGAYNRSLV